MPDSEDKNEKENECGLIFTLSQAVFRQFKLEKLQLSNHTFDFLLKHLKQGFENAGGSASCGFL